jgi:uncharacterized protein (DUF1697 family)
MPAVARQVVLVRGVNVGGHRRLPMAGFRALLCGLGYRDVSTYLQSGNAVVTGDDPPDLVERRVGEAIEAGFGFATRVVVRTAADVAAVVAANPLPEAAADPARFHVGFLGSGADRHRLAGLDPGPYHPDQVRAGDRVLYVWYRNGFSRSKLPAVLDQLLGEDLTARNWRTVTALVGLAGGGRPG